MDLELLEQPRRASSVITNERDRAGSGPPTLESAWIAADAFASGPWTANEHAPRIGRRRRAPGHAERRRRSHGALGSFFRALRGHPCDRPRDLRQQRNNYGALANASPKTKPAGACRGRGSESSDADV